MMVDDFVEFVARNHVVLPGALLSTTVSQRLGRVPVSALVERARKEQHYVFNARHVRDMWLPPSWEPLLQDTLRVAVSVMNDVHGWVRLERLAVQHPTRWSVGLRGEYTSVVFLINSNQVHVQVLGASEVPDAVATVCPSGLPPVRMAPMVVRDDAFAYFVREARTARTQWRLEEAFKASRMNLEGYEVINWIDDHTQARGSVTAWAGRGESVVGAHWFESERGGVVRVKTTTEHHEWRALSRSSLAVAVDEVSQLAACGLQRPEPTYGYAPSRDFSADQRDRWGR